jgi:hypothetical protein
MADQFCPNCGTEVDADARFCPSCGTTLSAGAEQEAIPAAPAWPPPEPEPLVPAEPPAVPGPLASAAPAVEPDAPTREVESVTQPVEDAAPEPGSSPEPPPAPPPAAPPAPGVAPGAGGLSGGGTEMPFTWPTMLSGWLIGGGSILGALVLIPRLAGAGYLVSLLLFLALLGIAATVFLADHVPQVPHLRLIILCVTMVGLGIALARAAFTIQGVDTLLLVAMLAAAGGALLLELKLDRPFPPQDRAGS